MIHLKPGRLCTVNKVVYRAKKKDSMHLLDCTGCALNSPFTCPNMAFQNVDNDEGRINCEEAGIILVKA